MKKTEKLSQLTKQLEQLDEQMTDNRLLTQSLVDAIMVENANVIKSSIEDESDFEEVQNDVSLIHKATRKIGQRFFNLFKVTFIVEFAGIPLIHFTIPKINDDGKAIN